MIHTDILLYNCLNVSLYFVWKSVLTIPYDYIIQPISQITKRQIHVILSSFLNICFSSIFLSYYLLILFLYSFTCIECEDWPSTNCKLKQQCIFLKKNPLEFIFFLTLCWIKPNMQCASMQFTLFYFEKRPFLVLYA